VCVCVLMYYLQSIIIASKQINTDFMHLACYFTLYSEVDLTKAAYSLKICYDIGPTPEVYTIAISVLMMVGI
jgi:hypothetical protein